MLCDICNNEKKKYFNILGGTICDDCFQQISTTSAFSEDYDYYKETVKKIVKNYIYEKSILSPVR